MSECPDCGMEHDGEGGFEPMAVPAMIFGGGLTDEQKVGLERIMDCMDRAQVRMERMSQGKDETLRAQYQALYRVLYGIADSAVIPITALITKGADPVTATKSVIAGIGGMMFMAGWEFGQFEASPEEQRRPVQPMREKSADLSDEDNEAARLLLADLPSDIDLDSEE